MLKISASVCSLLFISLSLVVGLGAEPAFEIRFEGMLIGLNEEYGLEPDDSNIKFGPYTNDKGCVLFLNRTKKASKFAESSKEYHARLVEHLFRRMQDPIFKTKMKSVAFGDNHVLYSELNENGSDMISAQHFYSFSWAGYHYDLLLNVIRGSESICAQSVTKIVVQH